MNNLALPEQLRAGYFRWTLFLVPLVAILGLLSGLVGGNTEESVWFAALRKPATFPPPIVFPVVWTALYVLMGLALAQVCAARGARWRAAAIAAFVVQLAVNLAWSPVFFGAHQIMAGLYVIVALDLLVLLTIGLFWKVRKVAALLLLPYLAWILFATVLNWQFLQLNRDLDGKQVSMPVQRLAI